MIPRLTFSTLLVALTVLPLAIEADAAEVLRFEETFDGPARFTSSTPLTRNGRDFFDIFTAAELAAATTNGGSDLRYTGNDGSVFAAQDVRGATGSTSQFLLTDAFDLSGLVAGRLEIDLAQQDPETFTWDASDYLRVEVEAGGVRKSLLFVENDGGTNNDISLDRDFSRDGDGLERIDSTFRTFSTGFDPAELSSVEDVQIRLTFSSGANGEDIAVDNLRVFGTLIPEPTTGALLLVSGIALLRRR